jgi:hypothetical protein
MKDTDIVIGRGVRVKPYWLEARRDQRVDGSTFRLDMRSGRVVAIDRAYQQVQVELTVKTWVGYDDLEVA